MRISKIVIIQLFSLTLCSMGISQSWELCGLQGEIVTSFVADPNDKSVIYAGTYSNFSAGTYGKIFKSTDGGVIWSIILDSVTVNSLAHHSFESGHLYAGLGVANLTTPGLIKTTNGGETWSWSDSGIFTDYRTSVFTIAVDPNTPNIMYCGTGGVGNGYPYKSVDGGLNWFVIDIPDSIHYFQGGTANIGISRFNTQVIYMDGSFYGSLFRTNDKGITWDSTAFSVMFGGLKDIEVTPSHPADLFVACSASPIMLNEDFGLYRSENYGESYIDVGTTLPDSGNFVQNLAVSITDQKLYVIGKDFGSTPEYPYLNYSLYLCTTDLDNIEWEQITHDSIQTLAPPTGLWIADKYLFLGTRSGLYRLDLSAYNSINTYTKSFTIDLLQNYPNPFNESTIIPWEYFDMRESAKILIYSINGQLVKTLNVSNMNTRKGEVLWNGYDMYNKPVPSGIYYYTTEIPNTEVRKMILIK